MLPCRLGHEREYRVQKKRIATYVKKSGFQQDHENKVAQILGLNKRREKTDHRAR